MNLYRLDASIRGDQSVSRAVADTAEAAWARSHPDGTVTRLDLAATPVSTETWTAALAGAFTPPDQRTPEHADAVARAASLADDLLAADAYLFAVPLYNWGVSQHVKSWLDVLLTDPRLRPGEQPMRGRPAALVVTRGGGYGPGTPKEGWDHATPYYRRIFGDLFGLDLHVSEVELTLAESTPAMADLRDLARQLLDAGHASAGRHGELLARSVLTAAP
ncbi:FMN-dependent NADH-azoreductase [Jidongwangia harbinensis]|uniref:FMN-dependent NADH-azoreductase n=1 Tax=Jidongwangia harbinensis TaxID=2878561 RepID=UPI001CDA2163|nr:NAD(P)H-dependent oxidoreductase [Jidongwangia harbinensis]MCA2217821.1 NAD(P)H-dependent oxidoreductase [Jidongwangia harbinensis]